MNLRCPDIKVLKFGNVRKRILYQQILMEIDEYAIDGPLLQGGYKRQEHVPVIYLAGNEYN